MPGPGLGGRNTKEVGRRLVPQMLLLGVREAGHGGVRMQASAGPWYTAEVPVTLVSGILAHSSRSSVRVPRVMREDSGGVECGEGWAGEVGRDGLCRALPGLWVFLNRGFP